MRKGTRSTYKKTEEGIYESGGERIHGEEQDSGRMGLDREWKNLTDPPPKDRLEGSSAV